MATKLGQESPAHTRIDDVFKRLHLTESHDQRLFRTLRELASVGEEATVRMTTSLSGNADSEPVDG